MLKISIEWKIWPKNNLFWITMQQALLSDKAGIKLSINGIKHHIFHIVYLLVSLSSMYQQFKGEN